MRRVITIIAVLSLVSTSVCLGAFGDPPSWDKKNFDFGTDNSRTYLGTMSLKYGSAPTETVSANSTNLSYSAVAGHYNGLTCDTDHTVELRVKTQDTLYWNLDLYTAVAGWKIRFNNVNSGGDDEFLDMDGNPLVDFTVDSTQWHTYRVVFDTTGASGEVNGTASLYIDGNAPAVATVDITSEYPGSAWGNQYWQLDAGNASTTGTIDLDYFRMATGAYHIPEPVTLALLAMGGVLALVRRRR